VGVYAQVASLLRFLHHLMTPCGGLLTFGARGSCYHAVRAHEATRIGKLLIKPLRAQQIEVELRELLA
jgi:hypothetical protein